MQTNEGKGETQRRLLSLRSLIDTASYRLLPGACLLCGLSAGKNIDLCSICQQNLPLLDTHCDICALPLKHPATCGHCLDKPPSFARVQTPFLYQHPIDKLLQNFKFNGRLAAGKVLSQLLADHLKIQLKTDNHTRPDLIVPIPLHWKKHLSRGFNQSEVIAKELSLQLKIAQNSNLLKRIVNTTEQHTLPRKERLANPRRAFVLAASNKTLTGRRIALVDDVLTTGSTAEAASRTLIKNGARSVEIWALARTSLDN